ncbi:MAG: HAMP domain-containing histidine kinase, partial [Chlorobiales bacterium]|nr:HAMP domain-containing histidine kinase [Chlorobiales bacterium]
SVAMRGMLKADRKEEFEEVKIIDETGDIFIKLYSKQIVLDGDSDVGAVFILQDITTLRKLVDMRADLITNVAHEFKTPLTAIRGIAETLIDNKGIDQEKSVSFLKRVINQADRLTNLSSDLLELSRIESREDISFNETHDIRPIIEESFNALKQRAKLKDIEFICEHSEDLLNVVCDSHSIMQIVDNLLDNAIKYTESGGTVRIKAFREGRNVIIEVHDSGRGIDSSELERVFERFYRIKDAHTPENGGTGLGLAIVQSIVNSHEGKVEVESTPGSGSVFRISIPYKVDFE